MRRHWASVAGILAFAAVGFATQTANAQRVVVVEEGYVDGPRFRGGVSLTGGGIFVDGLSEGLVGLDGRLGVQINNLIGVYAQPYFSLGAGKDYAGISTFVGTAGADAVIDFTLGNVLFLGVGGGAGVLQNVAAEDILFRAGFYPLVVHRARRARRGGLMVGVDVRPYFFSESGLGGASQGFTVLNVIGKIGWEAF